jgi:hypothetical protein
MIPQFAALGTGVQTLTVMHEIGHEDVQSCNLPEMRCPQGQVHKGSKMDVFVMAFKDRSCN